MTGLIQTPSIPACSTGDRETSPPARSVNLLGFDFGSTTSSAVAARMRVGRHRFSGEVSLERPEIIYRSKTVFTPFTGEDLDIPALRRIIRGWMADGRLETDDIFSGGAIVTGLAATRRNADKLTALVHEYAGESLIATADDPALESWLAFMGSCYGLSRRHPRRPVLNLDIGGGTTNAALGLNGDILHTGCAFIGARHVRFSPGSYRLTGISSFGEKLLRQLDLAKTPGEILEADARDRLLDWMIRYLEEIATGRRDLATDARFAFLEQLPLNVPEMDHEPLITFSGGVGALVYRAAVGEPMPGITAFGDLGVDLARRIASSPILSKNLVNCMPESRGHATVYGLALHHTEISGTTLFLPNPEWLPLKDLPVVARLRVDDKASRISHALKMVQKCKAGGAIQVTGTPGHADSHQPVTRFRRFGRLLGALMKDADWPADRPVILLMNSNSGKTVGNYATGWRQHALPLLVLDEIPDRDTQFVTIGRKKGALVPVSFFGMHHETTRTTSSITNTQDTC